MTTTELIKILKDNECGGITHKPRELSLTINGKFMPNPQITLSSTGDGICGAEIDLDVDGEFYEEQEPQTDIRDNQVKDELNRVKDELESCEDCISRNHLLDLLNKKGIPYNAEINEVIMNMPSVQPKTDILDKISEEIEASKDCGRAFELGLDMAIKIISKYRQEE